jgi:hypothetical protein
MERKQERHNGVSFCVHYRRNAQPDKYGRSNMLVYFFWRQLKRVSVLLLYHISAATL